MSSFLPTLLGTIAGGAIAIFGQWFTANRSAATARKAAQNEFERGNVKGVQEAMAELWRLVNAGRPGGAPQDQGMAMIKATLHRTRLYDQQLADDILAWTTKCSRSVKDGKLDEAQVKDLKTEYLTLLLQLGDSLRNLHPK